MACKISGSMNTRSLSAPQNPIVLNISSLELSSSNESSSRNFTVEFTWSRPSQRNGSYYFRLEYSAVQSFDGGRSLPTEIENPITADKLFVTGLPYAMYKVKIFAYNIKRGHSYRGPQVAENHLSIPIGRLKLI
jgi:hypothetical protein